MGSTTTATALSESASKLCGNKKKIKKKWVQNCIYTYNKFGKESFFNLSHHVSLAWVAYLQESRFLFLFLFGFFFFGGGGRGEEEEEGNDHYFWD